MVHGYSSELNSLAGLVNSYAASLDGLAQQIGSCVGVAASSWHDGTRPRYEEAFEGIASVLQNHAENLRSQSGQIAARAQHYEQLERG